MNKLNFWINLILSAILMSLTVPVIIFGRPGFDWWAGMSEIDWIGAFKN